MAAGASCLRLPEAHGERISRRQMELLRQVAAHGPLPVSSPALPATPDRRLSHVADHSRLTPASTVVADGGPVKKGDKPKAAFRLLLATCPNAPSARVAARRFGRCPRPRFASASSTFSPSAAMTVVPSAQPHSGRRSDAALRQLGHGPVQGCADRRARSAATSARSTSSAACAWPASTTTSRRSAGRRATTPSSRCSATGASATTSRARRSPGPSSC